MDHNAFTWDEGEEQLLDDNMMEDVEMVDDNGAADDDDDCTDGVTNLMGELSIDRFFDNFESNIEWGGYDYDVERDIVDGEEDGNDRDGAELLCME